MNQTQVKVPPYRGQRSAADPELNLSSEAGIHAYLHILRNRKGVLIGSVLATLSIAFFVNITQTPIYEASAELVLQPRDSRNTAPTQSLSFSIQDPTYLLTQFRLIRGPFLAEKVLKKLEQTENRTPLLENFSIRPSRKKKDPGVFSDKEHRALVGAIQRSIAARQVERGARIIEISLAGEVPPMVARLANAAAETYVETNYESHMDSFRQNFLMISKSLAEIREKIKTGEAAFQKIDSEIRLLEALKIYGDRHPQVVQLRAEIPQLAQKLSRGMQNLAMMEVSQQKDLVPLLTTASTELAALEKIESDLYTLRPILEQELNTNREMYNSIFRKLQEVEVSGGESVWMDAKVVEPASVPSRPVRPNKKMNLLMGLFVGLFLGIGLAFFREYLDSTMRGMEDVQNYLKLFPLGMVPFVSFAKEDSANAGGEPVVRQEKLYWLASDSDVPLYVSEAYRIIRTNLAFGSLDASLKVLQVTSAVKGEGKTTTAANLAISLAQAGSRVLLVDADLRRPALHRILGVPESGGGLSDGLTNGRSWESLTVETTTPNLFFLSAGSIPPNPSELLSSKRMKSFIDELRERYDFVVMDSPPVISVADAAIIASRVDGTIFVSRSGFVPRHLCLQAKNALESVNGKVVGCVLNSVHSQHQPYHYEQYHRHYGRYDGAETSKTEEKNLKEELSGTLERVKALQEPLWILFSRGWERLGGIWKKDRKKESKSSVGAQ